MTPHDPPSGAQFALDPPSVDEAQADAELQLAAKTILLLIAGIERATHLYDANNAVMAKLMGELSEALEVAGRHVGERVGVQIMGDNFFVNKRLLKLDFKNFGRAVEVRRLFHNLGIDELVIPANIGVEGLIQLFAAIAAAPDDASALERLLDGQVADVAANQVQGSLSTSVATDRSRLCFKLYCVLRVVLVDMISHPDASDPRKLLRVKRIVQLLIDHSASEQGLLFGLATSRGSGTVGAVEHMAQASILTILFGQALGLTRVQIFHLALAALFHELGTVMGARHPATPEVPDLPALHAVRYVVTGGALGEDALARAVVCYERQRELSGEAAKVEDRAVHTRVVAVVDAFLTGVQSGLLPAQAMKWLMGKGRERLDRGIVTCFVRAFGAFPVGSVVQLSSGHLAVVYRLHRAAEQVGSPVLIVVTNPEGQLLEEPGTLDLAAHPNLQIARAVDPAEHDINPLDYFAVPERTPFHF